MFQLIFIFQTNLMIGSPPVTWFLGIKANAPKCIFGSNDIPYIGYIITREGIKPDMKNI